MSGLSADCCADFPLLSSHLLSVSAGLKSCQIVHNTYLLGLFNILVNLYVFSKSIDIYLEIIFICVNFNTLILFAFKSSSKKVKDPALSRLGLEFTIVLSRCAEPVKIKSDSKWCICQLIVKDVYQCHFDMIIEAFNSNKFCLLSNYHLGHWELHNAFKLSNFSFSAFFLRKTPISFL